jgi:hypothetical protein
MFVFAAYTDTRRECQKQNDNERRRQSLQKSSEGPFRRALRDARRSFEILYKHSDIFVFFRDINLQTLIFNAPARRRHPRRCRLRQGSARRPSDCAPENRTAPFFPPNYKLCASTYVFRTKWIIVWYPLPCFLKKAIHTDRAAA